MNRRGVFAILVFSLLFASAVGALDLRDGRVILSLDEKTSRFTVYYLADAVRNKYVALLYDQEPRTSFPTLSWNGKTYRLGESPDFRFTVKAEGADAVVEYRSGFACVRERLRLIRSKGATDADGLLVEFSIENLSRDTASVGLRLLWDTYLGEKSRKHFELDGTQTITGERIFSGASIPGKVISPGDSGSSLQIQLVGEGLTRPDKCLLANWKRLNDSGWSFEPSAGRGFTLLPYSIEDSAAALFYEPSDLRAGGTRLIRTAIGNHTESGYQSAPEGVKVAPSSATAATEPGRELGLPPDPFVTARTDMAALRALIERIDGMLASGNQPTAAQLEELRAQLQQIVVRRKGL